MNASVYMWKTPLISVGHKCPVHDGSDTAALWRLTHVCFAYTAVLCVCVLPCSRNPQIYIRSLSVAFYCFKASFHAQLKGCTSFHVEGNTGNFSGFFGMPRFLHLPSINMNVNRSLYFSVLALLFLPRETTIGNIVFCFFYNSTFYVYKGCCCSLYSWSSTKQWDHLMESTCV